MGYVSNANASTNNPIVNDNIIPKQTPILFFKLNPPQNLHNYYLIDIIPMIASFFMIIQLKEEEIAATYHLF